MYRLLPLCLLLVLNACSTGNLTAEKAEQNQQQAAEKLYGEAQQAIKNGSYLSAIEYLELLQARYPFGEIARVSQLDLAYSYYKNNLPEDAVATCDRFIQENPRHPRTDYAYYLRGLSFFQPEPSRLRQRLGVQQAMRPSHFDQQAFTYFQQLLDAYPNSEYGEETKGKMSLLRERMAKHEWHIAEYYLKRGAHVAAVRRLTDLFKQFPNTQATRLALDTLQTSYQHLALNDLAADIAKLKAAN